MKLVGKGYNKGEKEIKDSLDNVFKVFEKNYV